MKIYISTGQNKFQRTSEFVKYLIKKKIYNIELSSGPYEKNIIRKLTKYKKNIQLHNYFPVPEKPFILNLASKDKKIYKLSLDHIKKCINLTKRVGSKIFSFHAGFLIDPKVEDFGKTLTKFKTNNKSEIINLFIHRLNKLASYAKKRGVILLIENNVITKKNLIRFNRNPFLMTNFSETKKIMENTKNNIGLLVDVAHLKISAKTLKFNPKNYLIKTIKWTKAYHLSDNDGNSDNNNNTKKSSWFWKYLNKKAIFYTLELKNLGIHNIKNQIKLVSSKLKY